MIKTWTERRRNSSTYNEQEFIKKSRKIQIRLNFEKNAFSSLKCHFWKKITKIKNSPDNPHLGLELGIFHLEFSSQKCLADEIVIKISRNSPYI